MSVPTTCLHYVANYLKLTENWIYHNFPKEKYTCHILTRKAINKDLFPVKNITDISSLPVYKILFNYFIFKSLGFFPVFLNAAKKTNAKILHIHFGNQLIKLQVLIKKLNMPVVVSFYGADAFKYPFLPNNMKKMQNIFRQADKILVLGPYMKNALIKLGCEANKLEIHHLGIQVEKLNFYERKTKNNPIRFLLASSFVKKKGVDICLKALYKINKEYDFTLEIIGDGPLKNDIYTLVKQYKIEDKITFHGYKPYDYFINLAQKCDVFLQASRTTEENDKEGTPMSLVDAMACGIPVVSTKHSDIPEIVIDGLTGFLAEENNADAFYESIKKMLYLSDNQFSSFSKASRQHIEKEFNTKQQKRKLESIYDTLIKNYGN